MEKKEIVPIQLVDQKPTSKPAIPAKPKVAARIKIGQVDVHIYNGTDKYVLTTILKELSFHASRLHKDT